MAAADDAIASVGQVIEKIEESRQAGQAAMGEAEQVMSTAQALGTPGVIELVGHLQTKLEDLAAALTQAGDVADEAMTAAQALMT